MSEMEGAIRRRVDDAGERWGSTGAVAVVDAMEQYNVEEFRLNRPLLLTKQQAATALAMTYRQISRLMASGELTPVRIGRLVRFTPAELESFVERHSGPPIEAPEWPDRREPLTR